MQSTSDEEENSYDMNDDMSEDDALVDGCIEIPKDGHVEISDDDGVDMRNKKRQKGMKVGPKVLVQSSSKSSSKVWDHFEKVPRPSATEPGVTVLMAQCNYCKKFLSYKEKGGATSHLGRHIKNSCADYKLAMAQVASQTLLNFQPTSACDAGIPVLNSSREFSQDEVKKLIAR